jgi:hypothetical protein
MTEDERELLLMIAGYLIRLEESSAKSMNKLIPKNATCLKLRRLV